MVAPIIDQASEPNKLVLCFDGTGNTFSGSNADTNVVKILNKLDRHDPHQFHYYQTGVGTYDINETSVNKTWLGGVRSNISQTLDQAIGTTFDHHVMAGYRFLMRYHKPGDKIYMFGFSRGAFTARFLARMVHRVGLLCKGNEEMVPFAFRLYQRFLSGEIEDFKKAQPQKKKKKKAKAKKAQAKKQKGKHNVEQEPLLDHDDHDDSDDCDDCEDDHGDNFQSARNEVIAFSNTFCRKEHTVVDGEIVESDVKVYFLGIWDCVNSVAVLERNAPVPLPVKGTADYVRHAVSVDERRVKFKPALIAQDTRASYVPYEDTKEVWFPGCHGDVGGGWPAGDNDNVVDKGKPKTLWQRIKRFWTTLRPKEATHDVRKDPFQMSDVALSWMIRELELVGAANPPAAVKWSDNVNGYKRAFAREKSQKQALKGYIHDSLSFGTGTGFFTVLLWKFMEIIPIITRWELQGDEWERVRFPMNKGSYRDIPRDAVLHQSLVHRLRNVPNYSPGNNHGDDLPPCLKEKGVVPDFRPIHENDAVADPHHQTYMFPSTPHPPRPARNGLGSCSVM